MEYLSFALGFNFSSAKLETFKLCQEIEFLYDKVEQVGYIYDSDITLGKY